MKKVITLLTLVLTAAFFAPEVFADYLYDWENLPSVQVLDAVTDGADDGQDIAAAWHAQNQDYHYFRIDLYETPDSTSYADIYGIYLNTTAGGAEGAALSYVPNSFSGIDYVVDAHYNPNMGNNYYQIDFHSWDGNVLDKTGTPNFQYSENNGKTLEWEVTLTSIQFNNFTWQAATLTDANVTTFLYDETVPADSSISSVPIPASLVLFASGILGLVGLGRRQ